MDGTRATKRERSLIATVIKSLKGAGGGEEETVVQKNARPVPEARSSVPPPRRVGHVGGPVCTDVGTSVSRPAGRPLSVNGDVWSHLTGHYRIKYRQPAFSGARRNRGRKMPESIRRPPPPPLASTIRVHPHPAALIIGSGQPKPL